MTLVVNRIASQIFSKCRNLSILRNVTEMRSTTYARCYSQYPTAYQEPIVPQTSVKETLESEAYKEVELLPVRAALNYQTSSMFLDPEIMKFINYVMVDGRKDVARRVVMDALTQVKRFQVTKYHRAKPENREQIELDPVKVFRKAVFNARPYLVIIRIRLGATWYQVPKPISDKRSIATAMKWLIEAANDKVGKKMFYRVLAAELIAASENRGRVIARKIELHKLCEANKAYAHFRWG